jgi:hypothetical protein
MLLCVAVKEARAGCTASLGTLDFLDLISAVSVVMSFA